MLRSSCPASVATYFGFYRLLISSKAISLSTLGCISDFYSLSVEEVTECAGTLVAAGSYGTVTVRNIAGDLHVTTVQGKTVIDAPGGSVTVRNTGGDVRLVVLAGIRGDFDIDAEDGDISMAIARDASATFWLSARGGNIHSSVPVTGTMDRTLQTFQGRLNAGTHRVVLNVRRGNIIID